MRDPALLRAGLLLGPVLIGSLLWLLRRPGRREATGIFLALNWNLVSLLAVNRIAVGTGWWSFNVEGGTFLDVPIDLLIGWSVVWTLLVTLALPRHWNPGLVVVTAALAGLLLDWQLMPLAEPVVVLGERWLAGEIVSLTACLVPAALLARWTAGDVRLGLRAALQVVLFAAMTLWVVPEAIFAQLGGGWSVVSGRPLWLNVLAAQGVLAPAVVGVSAVQEFCERGKGTPLPLDPPSRLVTSGPYAYLANPMQVSMSLVFVAWGLFVESPAVLLAAAMAVVFGAGLGRWATDRALERRFGRRFAAYRSAVRAWWPRWRPGAIAGAAPARLYVDHDCRACSQVGAWIRARRPAGLEIVAAAEHPSGALARLTYEAGEPHESPAFTARGVAAVARALEHVHLGWACAGWILRLPVLRGVFQLLVDAAGPARSGLRSGR